MSNKYYQNISNFHFNKPCMHLSDRNRQKLQEYEMLLSISKLMQ